MAVEDFHERLYVGIVTALIVRGAEPDTASALATAYMGPLSSGFEAIMRPYRRVKAVTVEPTVYVQPQQPSQPRTMTPSDPHPQLQPDPMPPARQAPTGTPAIQDVLAQGNPRKWVAEGDVEAMQSWIQGLEAQGIRFPEK